MVSWLRMAKLRPIDIESPMLVEAVDAVEASSLPPGVEMVDAGARSRATEVALEPVERDPKRPPPGWMGSYLTCGFCGDFIRRDSCPTCAPITMLDHIVNSGPPKKMC